MKRFAPLFVTVLLLPQAVFAQEMASSTVTSTLPETVEARPVSVPVMETVALDPTAYHPVPDEFAAAVVYVPATKQFIYEFKGDTVRTAASLTKLVSGLTVLRQGPAWGKVVSMSSRDEVGGGRLRVSAGARLSVRDLWAVAIGSSANNATMALARVTGLSHAAFVQRMNQAAKAVGATQTSLVEPSGMDPANMTTARDMARIADAAFREPMMRSATTRATYRIAVVGERQSRELKTTIAPFILDPDVWTLGGKTGYLEESMYNLVARLRNVDGAGKPVAGTDVIVVVLGAPTKDGSFQSVKHLAQWAWQHHAF